MPGKNASVTLFVHRPSRADYSGVRLMSFVEPPVCRMWQAVKASHCGCENDPPSRANARDQPGHRNGRCRDLVERNDLVDAKPGAAQLALQLAPTIKMHVHAVDSAIIHPAIAERIAA